MAAGKERQTPHDKQRDTLAQAGNLRNSSPAWFCCVHCVLLSGSLLCQPNAQLLQTTRDPAMSSVGNGVTKHQNKPALDDGEPEGFDSVEKVLEVQLTSCLLSLAVVLIIFHSTSEGALSTCNACKRQCYPERRQRLAATFNV
jgi:hypothetical protein